MLLIKFPSRARPEKFFKCIENIQSLIGLVNYNIAATLDIDDETMCNIGVKERLKKYDNLIVYWGLSKNKIDAVNRSIPTGVSWKYLLVTSDDMVYIKKDFGKYILKAFEENPEAGLIHFPDGTMGERLITLPLMTKKYYELFGYVYNPSYESVYADNEQMDVAKKLGKYKYIPTDIVRHEHYRWGFGSQDELSKKEDGQESYKIDRETFLRRKAINFEI
jgi:hypothetical protein